MNRTGQTSRVEAAPSWGTQRRKGSDVQPRKQAQEQTKGGIRKGRIEA